MKFGKTLLSQQLPQWSTHYINYKDLKQQIKAVEANPAALDQFFFSLDNNLAAVDEFYNVKLAEYERRLQRAEGDVLLELQTSLRNLKWFGELNKRGFVKILKKLTKKTGQDSKGYLESRVLTSSFAQDNITASLLKINSLLSSQTSVEDPYEQWISRDDETFIEHLVAPSSKLQIALLNKSALFGAEKCVVAILGLNSPLSDPLDGSGYNFFHHHMISMGKTKTRNNTLELILKSIKPHQRPALLQRDHFKRSPLHYAAQYGLPHVVTIIKYLKQWNQWDSSPVDASKWKDGEGLTPLHLAILGSHVSSVQWLISNCDYKLTNSDTFILAARLGCIPILKLLIQCQGVDIDAMDDNHESALYIASKMDLLEVVRFLLDNGANAEIAESSFGWTPIFAAAAGGLLNVVILLKSSGAHYSKCDNSGWTPMEHACLRGHLAIADLLRPDEQLFKSTNSSLESLDKPTEKEKTKIVVGKKKVGHEALVDESVIIITLGSNDTRSGEVPLTLQPQDIPLSLVVQIGDQKTMLDLPLHDVEPITINSKDPYAETVYFDIKPTYGNDILGRGMLMLDALPSVGTHRTLLSKIMKVPIMDNKLSLLGRLTCEILVVTSFTHQDMKSRTEKYWKSLVSTRVIGHRGLGKNTLSQSLQLGENTVESFIAAASLGASYVEFDVQLTKDHIPVVYHDFTVAESGLDIPMHELTVEQFMDMSSVTKERKTNDDSHIRPRSSSYHQLTPTADENKMKFTRTFKSKGFKGNNRGSSIASNFVTLEELFRKIPKAVGFNIECKYPLLYEAQHEDMGETAVELNFWIDTMLKCVYDNCGERDVIFSSFHPEVCLMLSLKQPAIPILFLTEAGTAVMPDARCVSLQSAIRFANRWNLLGIVSAAEPIVKCPRLAQVVKGSGLVCFTYGVHNNLPENAKLQMDAGVDAVIVDNVLAVRKELTSMGA